jgi:transposase-like protein
MNDRLRQLRARVRTHQAGRAARAIRYPEALRREIVALLDDAREGRGAVASVARTLGVPARTLGLWRRRARRRPFRRVMVAGPTLPAAPVLVTPHGVRVDGLDLAGVVTVLRALA